MKTQQPAEGILLVKDWGQSKMYKAVCGCGDDVCSHTIDIEADDCGVHINIYTQTQTNFWSVSRWSHLWKLIINGRTNFETSIVLSEQAALNYAKTLQKAISDVRNFKKP